MYESCEKALAFRKAIRTINSCTTADHLESARTLIQIYLKRFGDGDVVGMADSELFEYLLKHKADEFNLKGVFVGFDDLN